MEMVGFRWMSQRLQNLIYQHQVSLAICEISWVFLHREIKCVSLLPTSLSHSSAEDDDKTKNWSMPDPVMEDFQCIKNNFRVCPLPIFNIDDCFIEAPEANGCLRNALVEVHFSLVHYKVSSPRQTHDSYNAMPKQVIVLNEAPIQELSIYKHKNIQSGPMRPKKLKYFCKDTEQDLKGKGVASGSCA